MKEQDIFYERTRYFLWKNKIFFMKEYILQGHRVLFFLCLVFKRLIHPCRSSPLPKPHPPSGYTHYCSWLSWGGGTAHVGFICGAPRLVRSSLGTPWQVPPPALPPSHVGGGLKCRISRLYCLCSVSAPVLSSLPPHIVSPAFLV